MFHGMMLSVFAIFMERGYHLKLNGKLLVKEDLNNAFIHGETNLSPMGNTGITEPVF